MITLHADIELLVLDHVSTFDSHGILLIESTDHAAVRSEKSLFDVKSMARRCDSSSLPSNRYQTLEPRRGD